MLSARRVHFFVCLITTHSQTVGLFFDVLRTSECKFKFALGLLDACDNNKYDGGLIEQRHTAAKVFWTSFQIFIKTSKLFYYTCW